MRKALSRLTAVTLMSAVLVTGSFAMSGEAAFAASKLPEKPKITKAAAVNNNTVNLKWSKAKNAEKYKIYRKKADGRFVLVKTTAKRECRNKKLAYGTRYAYKVTALSKAGRKSTSRIKVVFTKPEKPVITAKVQGINGVKVTWKSTKGAIKYKVYRRKTGGKYVLVKTTTALSYTNKKTAYDTKYTYKVKAVSKAGKMTESAAKTVVTGKKPAVPDEPSVPVTPDCAIVGHHFQVEKEAAPTCTSSGYTEYKCGRCPVTKKEAGALAFGHRWHITGMKPSTFTEEGYTKYGCYRCEETKEEVIPKKEQLVTPSAPDEPIVTVHVPLYEEKYLFYIKDKSGKVIYKTESDEEFNKISSKEKNIVDPDVVVSDEPPALPKMPEVEAYEEPEAEAPSVPDESPAPDNPNTPVVPEAPEEPEKPAERMVTVKVPVYETKKVYWIKHKGEIIFKTIDPQAFTDKQTECWSQAMQISYGSGAFDDNQDGCPDEKYKIIVGYDEDTFTESEYNYLLENSDIGKIPGIIVVWND